MVASAPARPRPASDGTAPGQEVGSGPLHARLHPQTIYYLRRKSSHRRRDLSPLNFKPLAPRLVASRGQAQGPTPGPTSASSLPASHFWPLGGLVHSVSREQNARRQKDLVCQATQ